MVRKTLLAIVLSYPAMIVTVAMFAVGRDVVAIGVMVWIGLIWAWVWTRKPKPDTRQWVYRRVDVPVASVWVRTKG